VADTDYLTFVSMNESLFTKVRVIGLTPMKRAGTPLEIANGCLFLASDESSFIKGAELAIDGGYLAQ
jgi:NAD(P)-dependent dehydrogenase (short-subunit alcohol dehydrogenase family)